MKDSRRDFLKYLLIGSSGLLAGKNRAFSHILHQKPNGQNLNTPTGDIADCIVIGAGMAGVVAARDLSFKVGYKTIVLEASHRAGGRILTLDIPGFGSPLEMGGEYIHKDRSRHISLWDDVDVYKPELVEVPRLLKGLMYYDGWEDHLRSELTMITGWNLWDIATFSNKIDTYNKPEYPNISAKEWLDKQNYSNFGRNLTDLYFSGHLPASLDQISVKGFATDRFSDQLKESKEHGFKNGYSQFVQQMTKGLDHNSGKTLDIRYNTQVAKIKYEKDGVEITTKQGEVFRAKAAIITASVGMLKSNEIEFQPPLPEVKEQALSWIDFGDRAKVIIKFREKFWPDDAVFINRIDNQREMSRTYFLPFSSDKDKNTVLSVYFSGPEADKIKKMSDREIIDALVRDFDRMYPGVAKKAGGSILKLLDLDQSGYPPFLKWQWSNDPFAKGAVSYLKAGLEEEGMMKVTSAREALADYKSTPGLFWAGEATAHGKYTQPSCTHGAHHTGKRAALEVTQYLNSAWA